MWENSLCTYQGWLPTLQYPESRASPSLWYNWGCTTCCPHAELLFTFSGTSIHTVQSVDILTRSPWNTRPQSQHACCFFTSASSSINLLARVLTAPMWVGVRKGWYLHLRAFSLAPAQHLWCGFFSSAGMGCVTLIRFKVKNSSLIYIIISIIRHKTINKRFNLT